jgi:hypothetical protein
MAPFCTCCRHRARRLLFRRCSKWLCIESCRCPSVQRLTLRWHGCVNIGAYTTNAAVVMVVLWCTPHATVCTVSVVGMRVMCRQLVNPSFRTDEAFLLLSLLLNRRSLVNSGTRVWSNMFDC